MTHWYAKIFEQLKGLNKTGKPLPKVKILTEILALPLFVANWLAIVAVTIKTVELVHIYFYPEQSYAKSHGTISIFSMMAAFIGAIPPAHILTTLLLYIIPPTRTIFESYTNTVNINYRKAQKKLMRSALVLTLPLWTIALLCALFPWQLQPNQHPTCRRNSTLHHKTTNSPTNKSYKL